MARKRKKTGNENSDVSRRDMLKIGATAGAATVLGPTMLTSWKSYAQTSVAEPIICAAEPQNSPSHRPFIDNLPIPSPAIPKNLFPAPAEFPVPGEAARAPHQRWNEFLPDVKYFLEAKAATQKFHTDYMPSYFWGFNGRYPSQTVLNAYGHPTIVRFKNSLPVIHNNGGRSEITIHLHNGHTASESDGFAQDFFGPGLFKDNHYANAYAGIDAFPGSNGVRGDPREAMHTFWFHDHRAQWTAPNNYLGLNGMYIVYDRTDPGHEFATSGSLRLPGYYGITDIPLILTDKLFCATDAARGRTEMFQITNNPTFGETPTGDKWVVNGKIQPKFAVRRRKYRFRILNTGPTKTWNLRLVGPNGVQRPWTAVAVDANFLRTPWQISSTDLQIPVATRYDVIIDFAQFPVGTSVYLRDSAAQFVSTTPIPDPAPGLPIGNVVMRFDIVGNTIIPDTPAIPATLVELPTMPAADAFFEWRFTRPQNPDGTCTGQNQINEMPFDPNRIDHVVLKGSTEEWVLRNDTCVSNWTHPVHIHFEEGRVLERTVRPNPVGEPNRRDPVTLLPDEQTNNARRDVYNLPPQHSVRLRMQFRDFVGRYLIHCHNMGHEDNFMMVRWDIVDSIAELRRKRQQIAEQRRAAGLSPEDGLPTNYRKDLAS